MVEYRTPEIVGTVLNAPLVTVQGTIAQSGGSVVVTGGTVVVSTVLSPPNVPDVGTVGTILAPQYVAAVGTVGTVQFLPPIGYIGTLGTQLTQPNLAYQGTLATVLSPVVVSTVLNAPLVTVQGTVTAASGSGGTVTATVLGTVGVYNLGGTVNVQGTVETTVVATITVGTLITPITGTLVAIGTLTAIGTLLNAPTVTVSSVGTVGTVQFMPVIPLVGTIGTILSPVQTFEVGGVSTFATHSATIVGAAGTLYGVVVSNQIPQVGSVAGTLLILHSTSQRMVFTVPAGQTGGFMLDRGMAFTGSLVASLLGTLDVTFLN